MIDYVIAASILFIAALTRSTFGFGFGIIAMALLVLTIGLTAAVPLVAVVSVTIGATILRTSWRDIDLRASWKLLIGTAIGIPVGLYLLINLPAYIVTNALGILIICLGIYNLVQPQLLTLNQPHWAYVFGFIGGMLGGAYNIPGPPVVIYGTLRKWSPMRFRATMQSFLLPAAILASTGHALNGLWSSTTLWFYLAALPGVFAAIFLGEYFNKRIAPERFKKYLYVGLIILGVMLLV